MKRKRILLGCLLLLVATGAFAWKRGETKRFLKNSDAFVLYSLEPDFESAIRKNPIWFHNAAVLGQVTISDPHEKTELTNALFGSFENIFSNGGRHISVSCHMPRHGIHAVSGERKMDLTICFECHNVEFFVDGESFIQSLVINPDDVKNLYNQTLHKHHLPLAK